MKQALMAIIIIVTVGSLGVMGTYAGFVDTEVSEGNSVQAGSLELYLENPTGIGESWGHSVKRTWHWENLKPTPRLMEPGDVLSSLVKLHSFSTLEAECVDITCVTVNSEPGDDEGIENIDENYILLTTGLTWDDDFDGLIDEDDVDGVDNDGDGLVDEDPGPGTNIPITANRGVYDKDRVMIITSMVYHMTTIIASEDDWLPYGYFTAADDKNGDDRISLHEFSLKGLHGLTPAPNSLGEMVFSMTIKFALETIRHGSMVDVDNEYQGDQTNMTLIFTLR